MDSTLRPECPDRNSMISLIVPVYNEEESLDLFLRTINDAIAHVRYDFEFVFINDGSTDLTLQKLLEAREADSRIKIINFSRNFGKDTALTAGYRFASGDAVIPMDVDLQDPPELIKDFVAKWEEGYDVVLGVRSERRSDTAFKSMTAGMFYKVFNLLCNNRIVPNAGDYRLMNRASVDALNQLPERIRFMKGLYAWVGFKQAVITYERPPRALGTSKWNTRKLWHFALDGITGFSTLPLRIWSGFGFLFALLGFLYAAYMIVRTIIGGVDVPGYASLMVALLVIGGMILVSLGIIGEYLGRIYEEVKERPLYIVRDAIGFENPTDMRYLKMTNLDKR